jgi:hypothetical protein
MFAASSFTPTVDPSPSILVIFPPLGVQMSVNMERQIIINAKPETITIDTARLR